MSGTDKRQHEPDDVQGKAKEEIGEATGNKHMESEGMEQHNKAKTQEAADDVEADEK